MVLIAVVLLALAIVIFVVDRRKHYKTRSSIKDLEEKLEKAYTELDASRLENANDKLHADHSFLALQIHKLEIQDLETQLPHLLAQLAPECPLRIIVSSSGRVLLDTGDLGNDQDLKLVKLLELADSGKVTTTLYGLDNIPEIVLGNLVTVANAIEEAAKKYYHIVTDPMTNIYNRWGISNKLRSEVRRSYRFGHTLSLIMLDLDKFKDVNDRYGHLAGDEVIYQVAEILSGHTREVDIVGRNIIHAENLTSPISQHVVGRFGERGDEFVILLPETKTAGAVKLAKEILRKIEDHEFSINQQDRIITIRISASIGIASHPNVAIDEIELLAKADAALYRSKKKDPRQGLRITVARKSRKSYLKG